jgi:hypothetical protein
VIIWAEFAGAWLLVAGPLYQDPAQAVRRLPE